MIWPIFSFAILGALATCLMMLRNTKKARAEMAARYSGITSVESAIASLESSRGVISERLSLLEKEEGERRSLLSAEYEDALSLRARLQMEVNKLEENIEDLSYGLYRPHFDFETTEEFKTQIELVRQKQKDLIRAKQIAPF